MESASLVVEQRCWKRAGLRDTLSLPSRLLWSRAAGMIQPVRTSWTGCLWEVPEQQRHILTPVLVDSHTGTPWYAIYLALDYHTLLHPTLTMLSQGLWECCEVNGSASWCPHAPRSWNYLGPFRVRSATAPIMSGEATKHSLTFCVTLFFAISGWWVQTLKTRDASKNRGVII